MADSDAKATSSAKSTAKRGMRNGGRAARFDQGKVLPDQGRRAVWGGLEGGCYNPMSQAEVLRIHRAALEILEDVGIADATDEVIEFACAKGAFINPFGRLSFPRALIEDLLAKAAREYVIYSRDPAHADLHVGGNRVYYSTSGEAVSMLDFEKRAYRPSTLKDLYDMARVVDALPNIHQFGQTVVPTEIEDLFEHDINVVYAVLAGTRKPVEHTFNSVKSIPAAMEIYSMVAGSEKKFRDRPFVSFGGCPIVSPLRFAQDNLDVLVKTSRLGLINDIAIAPQSGATAPAFLAGALVQVLAEGLACLAIVNIINPGCPMSFALWPFAVDLRTGGFSGGSGEVAVSMAAVAQLGRFYDLPTTVAASMSDAKMPDAQMGYEKGISAVVAGLAGANRVLESAGMMASLMGCSFEALVIDNDMLGMAQRVLRGIEVTDETLSIETIKSAVLGPGHYLAAEDTLKCMKTEYVYPAHASRSSINVWTSEGAMTMDERAHTVAKDLLQKHVVTGIPDVIDRAIRDRFPILLPREYMRV